MANEQDNAMVGRGEFYATIALLTGLFLLTHIGIAEEVQYLWWAVTALLLFLQAGSVILLWRHLWKGQAQNS